ncbi:hypothetical protein GCM10009558_092750 [Virgisporangium aurantiacum]
MRVLHPDSGGGVWLRDLTEAGVPVGAARHVAGVEPDDAVRWLWASTIDLYPGLLRAGLRLDRCHDLELTEALLLGVEGRWGEPRGLAAKMVGDGLARGPWRLEFPDIEQAAYDARWVARFLSAYANADLSTATALFRTAQLDGKLEQCLLMLAGSAVATIRRHTR